MKKLKRMWVKMLTWLKNNIKKDGGIRNGAKAVLFLLLVSVWSFIIMEIFCMHPFYKIKTYRIVWNIILYLFLAIMIWIPTRRVKCAGIGLIGFSGLIGCINYFVILFRGNPVSWGDFAQAKTALSVANGYSYTLNRNFWIALGMTVVGIALCAVIKEKKKEKRTSRQWIHTGMACAGIIGIWVILINSNILYKQILPIKWNPSIQSRANGYLLSFMADAASGKVQKPKDYDPELLEQLADDTSVTSSTQEIQPNIIVIMNESFSDLSVLGDIRTDEEYLPYFHSLTEDTIYGNLYVSPYGGNTVYSEFEFLTGNSMVNLPVGVVPYTNYIHGDKTPSLVWTLKQQKNPYQAVAIHPYDKAGYNRVVVYKSFGFDDFVTKDDFSDYKIDRKYISDQDDYEKLIDVYEQKKEGQPIFIFNVTMQNHGGYGERIYNMREKIHALDYKGGTDLDEYLSCIKESDTAFEYLINYFENVDEPTIILMFGDHQPRLSDKFYDMVYGKDTDDLTDEEIREKHIVPFVMWSNYQDLGGQYIEAISTNYLSTLLLDQTGVEQTKYQQFLKELHREYPVLSLAGVKTADGTWTTTEELEEQENTTLDLYEQLQYNYLFGKNNRVDEWFYPQTESQE